MSVNDRFPASAGASAVCGSHAPAALAEPLAAQLHAPELARRIVGSLSLRVGRKR